MGENYKITATIDGSGCRSGINDIKGDLSGLDAHASKVGSAIGTALKVGVLAAGAAITGALVGGTKAFMDYEQSLANVSKTVDGTKEQIAALGENNRNLATSTGIAVTSLNGVSATLGSLGVAYKDIAATTELVSKGSIAFGMDAEEMATKVSKISTVYQVPIEQSGKYLSAMNALGNATAATEPQILSFTQAFGPMATMFNVPIEKVAAFGATLISSGVDAEEGATSIRSAIEYAMNGPDLKMDDTTKAQIKAGADHIKQQYKEAGKSTEEASAAAKEYENAQKAAFNAANPGNTRMTEWAKLLGTDVKSLNKMLNDDFLGTMAKSSKALETISSSTDRSKKAFDIWGSYGFKVMGTMSSQAGNLDKNLKVVYADIASGSKSMTSEFNRQNDTLNGSWNRVMSGVNDVGITIGQVTSGPVKKFFDAFIAGVPKIKEFTSALLSVDWSKVSEMMASAFQSGVEQAKSLLTELGNSIMAQPWAQWFAAAGEAIINQPWGSWASQAINLLAAGLQAAISGLLQIGDWIHDKLAGWISSDGPRQLGRDIANTIGNAINSWFNSDKSIWDSLSDVWGTVTEWAGIGWQIVKGIGQGLLDNMYAAVQPSANKLLASFATASYEIQGTFAKAWNTILIGAANLVSGIYSAFSEVGTKIAGYLQPIVDKINEAYNAAKSAMSLGSSSPSQIVSYHDERTGADIAASDIDAYRQQNPTAVLSANTKTKTASGSYTSGGLIANSASITPSASNWQWAGYQTGGSGFVSSELQSAGDGKLYMITDKGDFVTLTGKETVASSIFDLIAPYTADYVTNAAEAGQAWADQVMPVATEIKSSSSEAATTTKTAAKEAAEQTKIAGQTLNTGITSGADLLKQDMYGIGSFLDSITNKAGNAISTVTSTATSAAKSSISLLDQTSKNALTIGNSIVGSFTSGANAVQIGLNEAGQRIAVIGSVAQQNASQGGIALLGSISQGSAYHTSAMKTGGQVLQLSALMSGQSLETGGANAGASLTNAANKLNQWGGVGNVPYGPVQRTGSSANVNLSGANVNLNGADASGNFQDVTCLGDTVLVNGLKYT
ncbi:phage tail tape measure protein, partial [Candidatus Pacearchaeota archaeon]|nr:phage tail tape measure protein [Candidatus Pacearchaeota archaeon]